MICVKSNTLAKDLELVMECTSYVYTKKCRMRVPEVFSGEIMCVKPKAVSKDLELMMECTTNSYPKQCMMRCSEVYSG
jgi:hypothetical protein